MAARHLPPEAEQMITARCPARDPLDSEDFDPVAFLNSRFDESTRISAVVQCLEETKKKLSGAEQEFLLAVEKQAQYGGAPGTGNSGAAVRANPLASAQAAVGSLSARVNTIKEKAQRSEETINAISDHIRKLDLAKKNITSSIYTLRCMQLWRLQLQAVVSAFEKEKYVQCRDALKEALSYQSQLSHHAHLPQIKEIIEQHADLCRQLDSKTYYLIFSSEDTSPLETLEEKVLSEVCGIIDLLGERSRNRIRDHLIENLLQPYKMRFKKGTEDAKLEKTERRYVFMRSILERYGSVLFSVFPPQWCVPQELCLSFCLRTKEELDYQLREAHGKIDVAVLTFVLQKTIDVEKDLTLMMEWKEDFTGRNSLPNYKYNGIILSAFKEHMGIFVKSEESLVKQVLAQPILGDGPTAVVGWNGEAEADIRIGATLPLAEDIFVFIKESLKRSLRIAQQEVLVDMGGVWRQALIKFSSHAGTLVPPAATSLRDLRRACIVANTALMCRITSKDLGEELQSRSGVPAAELQFQRVIDAFSSLYSSSIQSIVGGLNQTLTSLFQSYTKGCVEDTGRDKNSTIQTAARTSFRSVVTTLHDRFLTCSAIMSLEVLRFLLDKIAASVIPSFIRAIYSSSRTPSSAVKRFQEDTVALKKVFLELPNYNDPVRFATSALTIYSRLVSQHFETLLCSLKVLQSSTSNMKAFTELYHSTIPADDRSIAHFVRLVELKGVHREDVRQWITKLSKLGIEKETQKDATLLPSKRAIEK